MKELEKILEEINRRIDEYVDHDYVRGSGDVVKGLSIAKSIIRKHINDGWIPVEERLPEKPENGYQEPKYNVMIKDAIIPTTLKFTSKGKWKDDLGQEYEIIAWRPLPEPYRPEGSE